MSILYTQRLSVCRILSLLLLISGQLLLTACGSSAPVIPAGSPAASWQIGHVIDVKTGQSINLPAFLRTLSHYDIVYLGEEHYNQHHIEAALAVLRAALAESRSPVLTMEMFGWDGQAAIDEYISTADQDQQLFLEQARWKQNWGGSFENYAPLVSFSKEHHLPLWAMNPPKPLIRQVVKAGLAEARKGPDWTQWDMDREDIIDDLAYRTRILDQLKRCHGGGTDDDYLRMYEASMVRDEGMAKTVAKALLRIRQDRTAIRPLVVSYTGGGHIQFNLPIPKRVVRRIPDGVAHVTIYLASFDQTRIEDVHNLIREGIADYIWLTAISQEGPPQRCR